MEITHKQLPGGVYTDLIFAMKAQTTFLCHSMVPVMMMEGTRTNLNNYSNNIN